jgi:rRNA-processing protein FCF1
VLKKSTQKKFEAQEAQMFHVGKQCAATAEDLSRHNRTQSDLRQNIVSHVKDQYEKFSRQLATTQTAVNAQKNELHEQKQKSLHNAQLDQGSLSQLKSQFLAETKTFNENLTSQLKLIEKRISKQAVLFTSLDHGTAEWVNSTQESLGSRMTSLEQSFEQKIKSVNLNIGDVHQSAEIARGNFQADVRKLREEFTQLLQSNEETINRLDNHQDDRDASLKASVRKTMQLTEERMAEKMSLLQASYERVDKSLSDLENNLSLGLNTTMDGHIHEINMKHTELANTMQRGQQELSEKFTHDLQERIDRERQHHLEETRALIQEYAAKRDSELAAKYEEQFKPLILKFMVDQSESLKKDHDKQMESSFKTQLQEREQQLERKYEESFKPMIAKFITDQQRELREENEARIQSLLEKHADELSKLARRHSAVESEEDLRSLVLRIVEKEGASLGGASDEQMRAELGCLEEATQERLLSLKHTLEARCQQLDDFDALLPYLLADVDALRKRIRKAESGHVMVKKSRVSSSA